MASITATVVSGPIRVQVLLMGWSDGPVTVTRVHTDGTRWAVRGNDGVASVRSSGGLGAVLDDEAPYQQTVLYEASYNGTVLTSAPVTIDIDTAYLTVPGRPSLRIAPMLVARPSASRERPGTVIAPRGRRNRLVITDSLKGRRFQLRIRTRTWQEGDLLEEILEAGSTLLVRAPRTRWPWCYATVTGVESSPRVPWRPPVDVAAGSVALWEEWTLSCEEADPPVGGITGDPVGAWDAVTAAGKTWDQLKAAGVTWTALGLGAY